MCSSSIGTHSLGVSTLFQLFIFIFIGKYLNSFNFFFLLRYTYCCWHPLAWSEYINIWLWFHFSKEMWPSLCLFQLESFLFFAGEWHGINFDQNYGDAAFHAVDVGRLAFWSLSFSWLLSQSVLIFQLQLSFVSKRFDLQTSVDFFLKAFWSLNSSWFFSRSYLISYLQVSWTLFGGPGKRVRYLGKVPTNYLN